MTNLADNYARVLFEMDVDPGDIENARELLTGSEELAEALVSPIISTAEKQKVIDGLFPDTLKNFFKVMSDYGDIGCAGEMFLSYDGLVREEAQTIAATFAYVTKPDDDQISRLKKKLAKDYHKENVELELIEDKSLIGGFVLTVGDYVLDQSVKTSVQKLRRHFAER